MKAKALGKGTCKAPIIQVARLKAQTADLTLEQRSVRLDLFSDSEKAIYNAQVELEKVGASKGLTEASILLSKARQLVTDYLWKKTTLK